MDCSRWWRRKNAGQPKGTVLLETGKRDFPVTLVSISVHLSHQCWPAVVGMRWGCTRPRGVREQRVNALASSSLGNEASGPGGWGGTWARIWFIPGNRRLAGVAVKGRLLKGPLTLLSKPQCGKSSMYPPLTNSQLLIYVSSGPAI